MKIVVLDGYTLYSEREKWTALEQLGELVIYPRTSREETVSRALDADVLFTNKTVLDGEIIMQLPRLKYIGVLATGYNIVDVKAAAARGVVVTNVPAYSTDSVAQMAFAHLLNITQRVDHYAGEVRMGVWSGQPDFCYQNTPLTELAGKVIGIVGLGRTGAATARVAEAFGMVVWAYTSKTQEELPVGWKKVGLDELFAGADVVSLHCPLNEQTAHLVNASRLAIMKESAVLINTGRGGLVDEVALAEALSSGKLRAAGLDVMVSEPPVADNPLLRLENCFITPHLAWATDEAKQRLMKQAAANLDAWMKNEPINIIR